VQGGVRLDQPWHDGVEELVEDCHGEPAIGEDCPIRRA
jgi:hypothetical protein